MTDRARNLRAVRSTAMKQLGFGPEVMKQTKVCPVCGTTAGADEAECFRCGADLPRETLFDLYRSLHQSCPQCGTVAARTSAYCPDCGAQLKQQTSGFLQAEAI